LIFLNDPLRSNHCPKKVPAALRLPALQQQCSGSTGLTFAVHRTAFPCFALRIVPHAAGALTLVLPTHGLHSTTHAAAAHAMLAMFSGCGYRRAVCTRARGILSMAMICRIGQQLRTGQHSRCKRRPQQQSFHHLDLL
jgi:hypothetical protein